MTEQTDLTWLSDALDAIGNSRLEALVGSEQSNRLSNLARQIALPSNCLLEVNLCRDDQIALCMPIAATDGSLDIVLGRHPSANMTSLLENKRSDRILQTLGSMPDVQSMLMPMWLEWDIDPLVGKQPPLSIYLTFKQPGNEPWLVAWLAKNHAVFIPNLHFSQFGVAVNRCLAALPQGTYVNSIGSMLGRDPAVLRFVISALPASEALKYLLKCGAVIDNGARDSIALLHAHNRAVGLFLDFDANGMRVSGLDIVTKAGATFDRVVEPLISALLPEKKQQQTLEALRDWHGHFDAGKASVSVTLNHLKIKIAAGCGPELKAYLSIVRRFTEIGSRI